jgi:hypothetical protein
LQRERRCSDQNAQMVSWRGVILSKHSMIVLFPNVNSGCDCFLLTFLHSHPFQLRCLCACNLLKQNRAGQHVGHGPWRNSSHQSGSVRTDCLEDDG